MSKLTKVESGRLGGLKAKELRKKQYEENPSYCKNCEHILSYEKRKNMFCNKSCAASYNNIGICRNKKQDNIQLCICCQNDIIDLKCKKRKYCSVQCKTTYEWNAHKLYIDQTCQAKTSLHAKKYLIEKFGVKCEICKITQWCEKPVPLVIDHIDGNSENNKMTNFRLVCGNCNMQLPTFAGRNRGKGRYCRRQRYKKGKSS